MGAGVAYANVGGETTRPQRAYYPNCANRALAPVRCPQNKE